MWKAEKDEKGCSARCKNRGKTCCIFPRLVCSQASEKKLRQWCPPITKGCFLHDIAMRLNNVRLSCIQTRSCISKNICKATKKLTLKQAICLRKNSRVNSDIGLQLMCRIPLLIDRLHQQTGYLP